MPIRTRAFHFGDPTLDLYISGVAFHVSDQQLFEAASPFGNVVRVRIVRDRTTDRGLGYGFIRAENAIEAQKIREGLTGLALGHRILKAKPVAPKPRSFSEEEGTE